MTESATSRAELMTAVSAERIAALRDAELLKDWRLEDESEDWPVELPILRVAQLVAAADAGYAGTDVFMWMGAYLSGELPGVQLEEWQHTPPLSPPWEWRAQAQARVSQAMKASRWTDRADGGVNWRLIVPLANEAKDEGPIDHVSMRKGLLTDRRDVSELGQVQSATVVVSRLSGLSIETIKRMSLMDWAYVQLTMNHFFHLSLDESVLNL